MALSIRARIALFGALVVCGTVALFGFLLFVVIRTAGIAAVDQDLRADRPGTTFSAIAAPNGELQPVRPGGQGPIPVRLPLPIALGAYTIRVAAGDDVRVYVRPLG